MSEIEDFVTALEGFEDEAIYTLRDGHIAVSPFPEYPGEIIFPVKFTGKLYRAYLAGQEEAKRDELDIYSAWWLSFVAVDPIIKVAGMSLEFDDNDLSLNRWGVAMLMRWANPFLTAMPWLRPSGTGTEKAEQPPG